MGYKIGMAGCFLLIAQILAVAAVGVYGDGAVPRWMAYGMVPAAAMAFAGLAMFIWGDGRS